MINDAPEGDARRTSGRFLDMSKFLVRAIVMGSSSHRVVLQMKLSWGALLRRSPIAAALR